MQLGRVSCTTTNNQTILGEILSSECLYNIYNDTTHSQHIHNVILRSTPSYVLYGRTPLHCPLKCKGNFQFCFLFYLSSQIIQIKYNKVNKVYKIESPSTVKRTGWILFGIMLLSMLALLSSPSSQLLMSWSPSLLMLVLWAPSWYEQSHEDMTNLIIVNRNKKTLIIYNHEQGKLLQNNITFTSITYFWLFVLAFRCNFLSWILSN